MAGILTRSNIICGLLLLGVSACDGLPPPQAGPVGHPEIWEPTPTFADEFEGSALDRNKWGTIYPGSDDENYGDTDSNDVSSGTIRLRLRSDQLGTLRNTNITTGRGAKTPFRQQYGWFEVRAKMPSTPGFVSAFWLWVQNAAAEGGLAGNGRPRAHPLDGDEVDIFEQFSNNPLGNSHTVHYGPNPNDGFDHPGHWSELFKDQYSDTNMDLSTDFHVYALDWRPDRASFHMDAKLVGTSSHPPQMKMHMILGMGINESAGPVPPTFNAAFTIDYVRVYQLKGLR